MALLVATAAAGSASCRDLDVVTESYGTLAEAEAAGAVDRGWIPSGLPRGAHDLREAHDLDTGRQWGLFEFPSSESDAVRRLAPREIPIGDLFCDIPARIEWWPVLLRGRLDEERVRAAGLTAYGGGPDNLVVLVNWRQGRAYYWSAE